MQITVTTSDAFDARAKQMGMDPADLVTALLDQVAADSRPRIRVAQIKAAAAARKSLRADRTPQPSPAVKVK
jgi:antitoxin component of RelBE/YafQ-DinJ toxin-antitoxin module